MSQSTTLAPVPQTPFHKPPEFQFPDSVRTLRVAIYVRVSTKEQTKGYGIDAQIHSCTQYVGARPNWIIVDVYNDEGVSGTITDRPELLRLERDIIAGKIDIVLVAKLDRIGRKHETFWTWVWKLEKYGVKLATVTENIDASTDQGRFLLKQYEAIAEIEFNLIRARTVDGINAKLRAGGWPGGPCPWGLAAVKPDEGGSYLVVDEKQAKVIHLAVSLIVDEGKTGKETADLLNALGHRTSKGKRFTGSNLLQRLREDSLRGKMIYRNPEQRGKNSTILGPDGKPKYGDTTIIELPRILDDDRIVQLDFALKRNARMITSNRREYPLSKRLLGECGRHYTGHGGVQEGGYVNQYVCSGRYGDNAQKGCKDSAIRCEDIEPFVWEQVVTFLEDDDRINALAEAWVGSAPDDAKIYSERLAEFDVQIANQQSAIDRVVQNFAALGVNMQTAQRNITALNKELEDLEKLRATAATQLEDLIAAASRATDLKNLVARARGRLFKLGRDQQREIMDLLNVRVELLGPAPGRLIGTPCRMTEWFQQHEQEVPHKVTDEQWERVLEVIKQHERVREADIPHIRGSLEAIFYKVRTGIMWKELPEGYPLWGSIVTRSRRWHERGVWDSIMLAMGPYQGTFAPARIILPPLRITGVVHELLVEPDGTVRHVLVSSSATRSFTISEP